MPDAGKKWGRKKKRNEALSNIRQDVYKKRERILKKSKTERKAITCSLRKKGQLPNQEREQLASSSV